MLQYKARDMMMQDDSARRAVHVMRQRKSVVYSVQGGNEWVSECKRQCVSHGHQSALKL